MPADEAVSGRPGRVAFAPARLILFVLLALAAWQAWPTLRKVPAAIAFPYALDREEGFLVVQARRLRAGESIYPRVGGDMFLVGNYPPVFPAAIAAAAMGGPPSLGHGRAVVALSLLALAAGLAFAVLDRTRLPEAAGIAALLPFGSFEFAYWAPLARADLPAAAFALWGIILAVRAKGPRAWYAAGALLVLAVYTKQTQVLAVATVLISLWRIHGRACALAFGWKLAVALAVPGLLLLAVTRGQAWLHLVTYNANAMHWDQLAVWARHVGRFSGFLLAGAAAAAFLARREGDGQPLLTASTVWLGMSAFEALSLAKAGAAANYLIDFQLALSLWIGLRLLPAEAGPGAALPARVLAAALALHLIVPMPPHRRDILANVSAPTEAQREGSMELEARLVAAEGPVLCEDPVPLMRLGRPVTYQPFIAAQLAREGLVDLAPLDAQVRAGAYDLVVTMQDVDNDPVLFGFADSTRDAMRAGYRPAGRIQAGPVTYFLREPASR